ncbi:MAG TPA: hypothetical protein VNG33_12315 [Polyangiaceae bacterium]|nr:hypothetical protein [Polyangiaceae bacterium]
MAFSQRCLLVALLLVGPRVALAQDAKAAAVSAYDEAEALLAKGKVAEACPRYAESQRLDPQLGTLLHLADCMERNGQTASAWAGFREAAELAEKRGDSRKDLADQRAAALQPRLSHLQLKVSPLPGLRVERDDVLVGAALWGASVPTDPGPHLIKVSAPGRLPWQGTALVKADASTTTLAVPPLQPAPAGTEPAPKPDGGAATTPEPGPAPAAGGSGLGQRWPALVAVGVGVAGVAVGSVFGLQSISHKKDADQYCNGADCTDQRGMTLRSDARSAGNISTVAFVVGGVGLVTGTVLWFALPTKTEQTGRRNEFRIGLGRGVTLEHTW